MAAAESRSNNHRAAVGGVLVGGNQRVADASATQVTSLPSAPTTRKEGIYAKKDNSNYQRFVEYNKPQQHNQIGSTEAPSIGKAPLVGWHNGSPSLSPTSPEEVEAVQSQPAQEKKPALADTPSESSGIGRDEDDDEADCVDGHVGLDGRAPMPRSLGSCSLGSSGELEPISSHAVVVVDESESQKQQERQGRGSPVTSNQDSSERSQGILVKRAPGLLAELNGVRVGPAPLEKDSIDGSDALLDVYNHGDDEDGSTSGSSSSSSEGSKKPKIPDGGWGWIVVLSSLCISMIADGVSFSFGLLYIEFLYEFEESKSTTAWIGSLFMAVPLLSGPVMSALVDRYGCRKMTILGGIISGTGFVLSSYVNTIGVMYLTFGVLAGLGLGLCYVTAVVSIAFWFDKKRTLAVGLGACGTGIGTFVYAPMTTFFIEEYGWRGCVLLLSGTFFNMIVCGCVMRDPEWWVLEQKKQQQQPVTPRKDKIKAVDRSRSEGSPTATEANQIDEFPGVEEIRKMMKSGRAPEYLLQSLSTSTDANNQAGNNPGFRSVVNLPTFVRQSEKVPLEVLESLSSNSRLYNVILENYPSLLLCRSASDKNLDEPNGDANNKSGVTMSMRLKQAKDKGKKSQSRPGSTHASTKVLAARRMSRKDLEEANPLLAKEVAQAMEEAEMAKSISRPHLPGCPGGVVRTDSLPWLRRQFSTNTHYFKDIRVHRNSVMYRGAVLNLHKYRLRASSCPDIYRNSMTTLAKENEEKWYSELVDLLKGMMDFSMFSELHFLLLSLSTILLFTWFIVPYFYLAEHLTRQGYSETLAAELLSYIGITNTIGMIGLGWAGDQPWMNVTKTYTCCLIACGISVIMMPVFTHNYLALVITSCCFGLFFASNFSFTPVILVEIIPLERFTTAYGLSLLCQGIGNLLGPPLGGLIFDMTGRWELSFYMAGAWIIVAGFLMGIIPLTRNRKMWGSGPIEMEKESESGEA
ncbi:hypothetical protein QAD02_015445 [Eretmocerus hayati]|uniref:Uncharacterized protein n=1 Tax=Eretmocerus hayati TaxID=131215 RepID=A0ACC2P889_9HYME|nr:hypothetical protein QAD02_015445 [Eretmocerus hayati]